MEPALADGQRVAVTADVEPLVRGDIVVFKYPPDQSRRFIKRIVGMPGDRIEAQDGAIRVTQADTCHPVVASQTRGNPGFRTKVTR